MLNTEYSEVCACVFNKGVAYFPRLKMDIFHILIYKLDKMCDLTFNLFSLSPVSVSRLCSSEV